MTERNQRSGVRVAIVGGSGFIGTWLARALGDLGQQVTVLDIEEPASDVLQRCNYRACDVRKASDLAGAFEEFDTVYMLVSFLGKLCNEDPPGGWRTNVVGTANVLGELVQRSRPFRVVYFSSSMVYSSETKICPLPETAPTAGEHVYDRTKLACERLLTSFCHATSGKGIIFRPFSAYGPGRMSSRKGHFIGTWLELALMGKPLVIHGDGSQTVDLVHVHDIVRACVLAEKIGLRDGEVQTFNVGSGQDAQVRQIAEWIREVVPNLEFQWGPAVQHTIRRRWADIGKAQRVIGYNPEVSPEKGVKSLFEAALRGEDVTS